VFLTGELDGVIGPEYVDVDSLFMLAAIFVQPMGIGDVVTVSKESGLAIVAGVCEMRR